MTTAFKKTKLMALACTTRRGALLMTSALTLGSVLGSNAAAQETQKTQSPPLLEEVIVYANKHAENVQDVGASITALSANQVEKLGIASSTDIVSHMAGIETYNYIGQGHPQFIVRGIGTADFAQNTPPSAPVYQDEIYSASNVVSGFSLFDLDRVEVLKGPQGDLFGRNTTAGAVSYFFKRPTADFDARAKVAVSSYDAMSFEGAVGGPVTDTLKVRFALKAESVGSFFDNRPPPSIFPKSRFTNPKANVGDSHNIAGRLSVQYDPSDDLTILASVHYAKSTGDGFPLRSVGFVSKPGRTCALSPGDNTHKPVGAAPDPTNCGDILGYSDPSGKFNYQNDFIGQQTAEGEGALVRIEWRLGELTLTSISGGDHGFESVGTDTDGTPNFLLHKVRKYEVDSLSQEFRLANSADSRFFWLVGAYAGRDKISLRDDTTLSPLIGLTNFLDPTLSAFAADGALVTNEQSSPTYAAFAHSEFKFNEAWKLITGIRYTDIKLKMNSVTSFLYPTAFNAGQLPNLAYTADINGTGPGVIHADTRFSDVSGRVAMNWTPNDEVLIYLSASRGFRAGGFEGNFNLAADTTAPYDKEQLTAYELGWKTQWLDRALRINGAVYAYDYNGVQQRITGVSPVSNTPANFIQTLGDATQYGADLDVNWSPTRSLDFGASAAVVDQKIKSPIPLYDGNRFPYAPKVSGTLFARYNTDIGGVNWSVQADAKYTGQYFTTAENIKWLEQKAYTTINGRLEASVGDQNWTAGLWVKNLTNREYITSAYALFGAYVESFNVPRSVGVDLTYRW